MQANKRVIRLQNWILKNKKAWNTICGQGSFPISESEYMRLQQLLMENNFEEITLVLLTTHFYAVEGRLKQNMEPLADLFKEELRRRKPL